MNVVVPVAPNPPLLAGLAVRKRAPAFAERLAPWLSPLLVHAWS